AEELRPMVEVTDDSTLGMFSASPPEFVRIIIDVGEWVLKAAASGVIGNLVWDKREVLTNAALAPIRGVIDAIEKARGKAPVSATFAVGIASKHGPEVTLGIPLDDKSESIRVLYLLHVHRSS